jgi:hypothetical protein
MELAKEHALDPKLSKMAAFKIRSLQTILANLYIILIGMTFQMLLMI